MSDGSTRRRQGKPHRRLSKPSVLLVMLPGEQSLMEFAGSQGAQCLRRQGEAANGGTKSNGSE